MDPCSLVVQHHPRPHFPHVARTSLEQLMPLMLYAQTSWIDDELLNPPKREECLPTGIAIIDFLAIIAKLSIVMEYSSNRCVATTGLRFCFFNVHP